MRVFVAALCVGTMLVGSTSVARADGALVFDRALKDAAVAEVMWREKHEGVAERIAVLQQTYVATIFEGWSRWRLTGPDGGRDRDYGAYSRAIRGRLDAAGAAWVLINGKREDALYGLAEQVVGEAGAGDAQMLTDAWIDATADRVDAVFSALRTLGAPYRFGFAGPEAYDCSGLTRAVYSELDLPHKAAYQFEYLGTSNDFEEVGALVFFNGGTTAAGPYGISHVAIHLGAGIIIHASGSSEGVIIEHLDAMREPVGWSSPDDTQRL